MTIMEITEILEYLPHRYPFLLIDRVIDIEPGKSLTGLKNVSFNEPFFPGHFPLQPIMPGVLIIEALAQATGILAFKSEAEKPDKNAMYYLVGIDKARFKQPVLPGDQLILEVTLHRIKRGIGIFSGEAKVAGKLVANAELMCARRTIDK
jgi:3-hydroxyacyl-[acyl-carrier-protein] dehydratase